MVRGEGFVYILVFLLPIKCLLVQQLVGSLFGIYNINMAQGHENFYKLLKAEHANPTNTGTELDQVQAQDLLTMRPC